MSRVLVVDDEPSVQASVEGVLEKYGFNVECVADAESAMSAVENFEPDLIVLDILLPGSSGTDFCRDLRRTRDVPVIFLSGLDSEIDRIVGLELGADDYLTKPFNPGELLARVRAVLRRVRPKTTETAVLKNGPITLHRDSITVAVEGEPIELTRIEFQLLESFMARPTFAFTREQLKQQIYGHGVYVSDPTINSHIRRLRSKMEEFGLDPIATVRGIGYKLNHLD